MPKKKKKEPKSSGEFGMMGSDDSDDDSGTFVSNPMKANIPEAKTPKSKRMPKTPRTKKKDKEGPSAQSMAEIELAADSSDEELAEQLASRERSSSSSSKKSSQKTKKKDKEDPRARRQNVAEIELAADSSDEELAEQLASRERSSSSSSKKSSQKDLLMSNPLHELMDGDNEFLEKANSSEAGSSSVVFKGWVGVPNGKKGKKEKMESMYFCIRGSGLVWNVEVHESNKMKAVPKKAVGLSGAKLRFNVGVCAGVSLHNLESTKGGTVSFGLPDENALGEVDVRTGARSFDATPIAALSKFVEAVMDSGTPVVGPDGNQIDIPPGDEDESCTYLHEDQDQPQIIYNEVNGRLQVQDAFGPVAKARGMALGMLLRTVEGKRVAGLPLELVNQRVQDADKPCEMVFVDDPDESSEEEEEEDEDDDVIDCVFVNSGSIGIVFDEGEVEDTVVIDSIKSGSAAERYKMLKTGMLVKEVRGQPTADLDFDAIIELITDTKRPLQVSFAAT